VIQHVVTFVWQRGTTQTDITAITQMLGDLPDRVPALVAYHFGADLGLTEGTGDFAIVAMVADEAALREYLEHRDHVAIASRLRALAQNRIAVQINVDLKVTS